MEKIFANRGWMFHSHYKERLRHVWDDSGEMVTLPHTVCGLPYNYIDAGSYQGRFVYQKQFEAPAEWRGKKIYLTFEGVAHSANVYINGVFVCTHSCGYTAFSSEISDRLVFMDDPAVKHDNLITVVVDSRESLNQPPFGFVIDYLTYGGIYRDVYFETADPVHMENVFYEPSFSQPPRTRGMTLARLREVTLSGSVTTGITLSEEAKKCAMQQRLFVCQFLDGVQISNQPLFSDGSTSTLTGKIHLWDVNSPYTYELRTELRLDGRTVDTFTDRIGFRDIRVKNDGVFLNGRRLKLRGLNRHQSYPYVGYAMPASMQANDAYILHNELGLNAVRTSHYPQAQSFIRACDNEGLLVFMEVPGWQHIGDAEWKDTALKNVREMIMQYRNHPSVFLWGVRINESVDDDEFYMAANKIAKELDPNRPTGGVRCFRHSNLIEDVYAFNDFSHDGDNAGCLPKDEVTSDTYKPYLVSEYNGHMFPAKPFDNERARTEHAIRHANVLDAITAYDDILGSFGWCMFDYNTHSEFGSGDNICYHGVMDMFRNPKAASFVYSSQTGRRDVLGVSSDFNIGENPTGFFDRNFIFTNADSVKMYRNGRFIREFTKRDNKYSHMRGKVFLIDDYVGSMLIDGEGYDIKKSEQVKAALNHMAVYGQQLEFDLNRMKSRIGRRYGIDEDELEVLFSKYVGGWGGGRSEFKFEAIKDDKTVKTVIKGDVESVNLNVVTSSGALTEAETYDVMGLRVTAVDQNGNVLPYYGEQLNMDVVGPVSIIGPERIPFRGGMCGTYLKTIGREGEVAVRLSAPGAKTVMVRFGVLVNKIKEI